LYYRHLNRKVNSFDDKNPFFDHFFYKKPIFPCKSPDSAVCDWPLHPPERTAFAVVLIIQPTLAVSLPCVLGKPSHPVPSLPRQALSLSGLQFPVVMGATEQD